jgi:hypothetical protein
MDGRGRSYLYATLQRSYKNLKSGNDAVKNFKKKMRFQNHGYNDLQQKISE